MSQGFTNNSPIYSGYTAPTRQTFTSSSGTYTTPVGVVYIRVTGKGAGGGGGGGSTTNSIVGGSGGAEGGYFEKIYSSPAASYSYLVGAGGAAGAAGAIGTVGASTTFDTLTAVGGGPGNTGGAGGLAAGADGGTATGGDFNLAGQPSTPCIEQDSGAMYSGNGAGYGGGLAPSLATTAGNAGLANTGSGGSSGVGNAAGGAGGSGWIIVEEFYQLNTYGELLTFTGTGDVVKATAPTFAGTPAGTITSGTYTPTLTDTTNVAASTAYACQYLRVGNTVTVSGGVAIDPTTTATLTVLNMSLPIASTFAITQNLGGVFSAGIAADVYGGIRGDTGSNDAEFLYTPTDVANREIMFSFTYQII